MATLHVRPRLPAWHLVAGRPFGPSPAFARQLGSSSHDARGDDGVASSQRRAAGAAGLSRHSSVATHGIPRSPFSSQKRAFHSSAPQRRDHHFDTLKFVQRLKGEGFTEEQSVAMMKVLNDVIQERYARSHPIPSGSVEHASSSANIMATHVAYKT